MKCREEGVGWGAGGDFVVATRLKEEYQDVEVYYICRSCRLYIDVWKEKKKHGHKEHCRAVISTSLSIKKTCITGFSSHYKGNKSVFWGGHRHRDGAIEGE